MISRRDALFGAVVGAAAFLRRTTSMCASASQPKTPVAFAVPPGACDSHTHVFGDPQRFPMVAARVYTPEPASVDEMRALHRALRTTRVVVVQPSIYGTDNSCTLDAIRQLDANARGVAVIDEATTETALDGMARAGIRGIRLNLATAGVTDPVVARQRLRAAGERIKRRSWHVQINTQLSVIEAIKDEILAAPVPIVIDHFGGAQAARGVDQPGFAALVAVVQSGHAYVKVSAAYRTSMQTPDYPDVAPLAKALIAANPQRVLWGTDWPHPDSAPSPGRKPTDIAPLYQIDDGRMLNLLAAWAPDAGLRKTILVENPGRLYGF